MRHRLSAAVVGLTTIGLLCIAGCGDVVTYAKYSRQQGIDAMNAGNNEAAAGAFRDAMRQNPGDYQSSYYLGTLYAKSGRFTEAAGQFKTAIAVQKATWDGRNDKAFHTKIIQAYAAAVAKVDDHDATVNDLEQQARDSNTGEEAYTLALIYSARGDADSAIAAYAKAAQQAPQSFDIAKDQGLYLTQVGQKAPAEEALRRAYRISQSDNQVNDALRGLGVVPGPSLLTSDEMAKPLIPVGPIPNYIDKWTGKDKQTPPPPMSPTVPPAPAD